MKRSRLTSISSRQGSSPCSNEVADALFILKLPSIAKNGPFSWITAPSPSWLGLVKQTATATRDCVEPQWGEALSVQARPSQFIPSLAAASGSMAFMAQQR